MVYSGALLEFGDSRLDNDGGLLPAHGAAVQPHLLILHPRKLTDTYVQTLIARARMQHYSKLCVIPFISRALYYLWSCRNSMLMLSFSSQTRYRLRLLGSDGTGEAEFTLAGQVAQAIVGISPRNLIVLNNYPGIQPVTNLAVAGTKLCTPTSAGRNCIL
jgi:hypothetical protein